MNKLSNITIIILVLILGAVITDVIARWPQKTPEQIKVEAEVRLMEENQQKQIEMAERKIQMEEYAKKSEEVKAAEIQASAIKESSDSLRNTYIVTKLLFGK